MVQETALVTDDRNNAKKKRLAESGSDIDSNSQLEVYLFLSYSWFPPMIISTRVLEKFLLFWVAANMTF